ncbi:hypothetical protein [Pleomorphomonas sp. PLEO]|uniref:hypothetical protein n=1 Tax=Pleomorphomonas sp. PLEO TaxID=3239306 RepID=UPI00351E7C4D
MDEKADDAALVVGCRDANAKPDAPMGQIDAPVGADHQRQILFGASLAFDDQAAVASEPGVGPESERNGASPLEFEARLGSLGGRCNQWSSSLLR